MSPSLLLSPTEIHKQASHLNLEHMSRQIIDSRIGPNNLDAPDWFKAIEINPAYDTLRILL